MSELIEELRHHERDYPSLVHGPLCGRAADEIEALRDAISEYLATFDRCGGSESVSPGEFAARRQSMRDVVGGMPK